MELDEAVAIRTQSLQGVQVKAHVMKQALHVIDIAGNMHHARRVNGTLAFEEINQVQRERLNMILVYRLAVACRKFADWSPK